MTTMTPRQAEAVDLPFLDVLVLQDWALDRAVVYGLFDTRDAGRTVRYVGKSLGAVKRYLAHVRPGMDSPTKTRWVQSVLEDGGAIGMALLEVVEDAADLDEREWTWILRLRNLGLADLNGGNPPRGLRHKLEEAA